MKQHLRKRLFIGALCLQGMAVSAQWFDYSLWAGASLNNVKGFYESHWGYEVGASATYNFQKGNGGFVEGGLSLLKTQWGFYAVDKKDEKKLYRYEGSPAYLQIPLSVGYRHFFFKKFSIDLAGRIYAGYGLCGKGWGSESFFGPQNGKDIILPKYEDYNNVFKEGMNRFDWGAGLRLGIGIGSHWRLAVAHEWGLKRIIKGDASGLPNGTGKNRIWKFTLGYRF